MKNKKKLMEFLDNYQESYISIEDLSNLVGIKNREIEEYLSEYKNYSKDKALSYFRVVYKYYTKSGELIDDKKINSMFFTEKKKFKAVPVGLRNLYSYSKERKADLDFNKIKGQKHFRGEIDESDIGGLYTSEWMISNFTKVPYNSELKELLEFFPEDYKIEFNAKTKEFVVYCSRYKKEKFKDENLFVATVECLKNIAKKQNYYLIQLKSSGDKYIQTYSNAFYLEKDAEDYLKNNFKNGRTEKFFVKKVSF